MPSRFLPATLRRSLLADARARARTGKGHTPTLLAGAFLGLASTLACVGPPADLQQLLANGVFGQERDMSWHRGPRVAIGDSGPARFVTTLNQAFQLDRSMKLVRFQDRFYRAPGNDGYEAVLERLETELRAAGFGGADDRLTLSYLETDPEPIWNPKRGLVEIVLPDGDRRVLHSFDNEGANDRVLLPINAPACDVTGRIALKLEDLEEGMILVTEMPTHQVLQRAVNRGAAAIVSASLQIFNNDPSGKDRHRDAIQYRIFRKPPSLPVAQISPRSFETIEAAWLRNPGRVELHLRADVETQMRPLRTLVATVVGSERPEEAVAMSSHVQEPGASDNATGVAGLCESARNLAEVLQAGDLEWPARTVVFLWGDEFRQTEDWLDATSLRPVIGISSDMTGQSKETGAIALLERMPDPGAVRPLAPDEHTPWGAGDVDAEDLQPNGLSIIARCAMIDVGLGEPEGWECADHPWEGGSDHDIYIARGVPAILVWHFTDFTYHTSLDRLDFVDPDEMRRTAVALLSTAMSVADPEPGDLDRYLQSLTIEDADPEPIV